MTGYAIRVWSKRISQQLCAFHKIPQARVFGAATAMNVERVLLYQHTRDRIGRQGYPQERAPCGKRILSTLSRELIRSHFVEHLQTEANPLPAKPHIL